MSWQLTKQREWSQLADHFEFVRDMHGVPQDALHHAEGDVAIHTQMVLAALEALPEYQQLPEAQQQIVWAAALLHDVEKRSTTREEEGRIRSPGHAKGSYPLAIFCFVTWKRHLLSASRLPH